MVFSNNLTPDWSFACLADSENPTLGRFRYVGKWYSHKDPLALSKRQTSPTI